MQQTYMYEIMLEKRKKIKNKHRIQCGKVSIEFLMCAIAHREQQQQQQQSKPI